MTELAMFSNTQSFVKNLRWDIICMVIISGFAGIYFFQYFYPELKICSCPDYGNGDVWYFNYPVKEFLGESIRAGEFPLWNSMIGTGFPLFAEGQMAPFFVPNILFIALPTPIAFNVAYVLSFLTAGIGMYFFLRLHSLDRISTTYAGVLLMFSGYFITQISHLNLLQSASLIPILLILAEVMLRKITLPRIIVFALVLSQQYFAGYAQISFITLVVLGLYTAISLMVDKRAWPDWRNMGFAYAAIFAITSLLIAVQFLPSRELLGYSVRSGGYNPNYAAYFSYPFKHFATFFDPFIYGNPQEGTYVPADGVYFWENAGYVGIVPLITALLGFLEKKRRRLYITLVSIFVITGILMTGKYGPSFFLSSLPPFNLFRVPSRFLLAFSLSLIMISAVGLHVLYRLLAKRISGIVATTLCVIIALYACMHLLQTWYSYHLLEPPEEWTLPPETAQYIISQNASARMVPLKLDDIPESYYLQQGWDTKSVYPYFRTAMTPNSTMLWDISSAALYVGNIETNRYSLMLSILQSDDPETISKLLSLLAVQYVVTAADVPPLPNLEQTFKTTSGPADQPPYYVYENTSKLARARVVYDYDVVSTKEELHDYVISAQFTPEATAVLEEDIAMNTSPDDPGTSNIRISSETNTAVHLETDTTREGILLLADLYYPGWDAYIDGVETPIYPANMLQRAIVLPAGKHQVVFSYEPASFKWGAIISGITHFLVILVLARRARMYQ